jgi:tetratricopeptide (TPR) repeat protein
MYFYRNYQEQGDLRQANQARIEAERYFQKAIDLNPKVVESYVNLVMLYLGTDEAGKIQSVIDQMDKNQADYNRGAHLDKLVSLAVNSEDYYWAKFFISQQLKNSPDNILILKNLALCYAYLDDQINAAATAEKIKSLSPADAEAVDQFIADVKAGKYLKAQ